jgi:glycine/D-amino acid oxidase-like deaminating enzyme
MRQIKESSRMIPVMAETDVLVVGSGPGGLAAALAAAREGVDTMLVERHGSFGGNITQAQVETIAWYRHEKTVEAGGCRANLKLGGLIEAKHRYWILWDSGSRLDLVILMNTHRTPTLLKGLVF